MENISWLRQTKDKPAFPDVLWSRPVNKRYAGKLLIVGGHSQSFAEPSRAYAAAVKAGAGTVRILLPDALQKTLGKAFPEAEFAASTPIGSFSRKALELLMDLAGWSDGVLLAGGFGKNSETAILLESFVEKYTGQLGLTGDSLDYFLQKPSQLTDRTNTLLVGSLAQIQKLAQPKAAIKQTADLVQILNTLSNWTDGIPASVLTSHTTQIIAATGGKISTTQSEADREGSELAAYANVWLMQQPEKIFEALTTASYCYAHE
jgi:NAD(P)H-hydrate repair Nnr-like enzyme with NAD(P)H-hydrate dehydratase domain